MRHVGRSRRLEASVRRNLRTKRKHFDMPATRTISGKAATVTGRLRAKIRSSGYTAACGVRRHRAAAGATDTNPMFKHILLCLVDNNPYLSEGSRQAALVAASLGKQFGSRLTVLAVDKPDSQIDQEQRASALKFHLEEHGMEDYAMYERNDDKPPSVSCGDVADEVDAELVVVSADAVHEHSLNANLLAEFVDCPVLMVP